MKAQSILKTGKICLWVALATLLITGKPHSVYSQNNVNFTATVSPDPAIYPGYPSNGRLNVIIGTPNDLPGAITEIPAYTFAVVATAGGAVEFNLSQFTPPPGWELDTDNSDPTNAVVVNNAPITTEFSHLPIEISLPTRSKSPGTTTHLIDIESIRTGWADFNTQDHQPEAVVQVLDEALPVRLSSFNLLKEGSSSLLSWTTTEESNSSHFGIEHSTDAKSWKEIGRVRSTGNSNSLQRYSHTHQTPSGGMNYYRLKITDLDGSFEFGIIKSLEFPQQINIEIFPNPARDRFSIRSGNWEQVTGIELYNGIGIAAYRSGNRPEKEIQTGHLAPGMYILKITRADDSSETLRIVIGK